MKRERALIPDIKEQIASFLQTQSLKSLTPQDEIFADPTKHSYYSVVVNRQGKKQFLKIRTHNLDWEIKTFRHQYLIGKLLRENSKIALNQHVPRMATGKIGGKLDYFLSEYIEGENMGSRSQYGTIKFTERDIATLINIAKALIDFPINLLPADFEKRKSKFYQDWIAKSEYRKDPKLRRILDKNWQQFEQKASSLSHGDFKPNNFIRSKSGKLLVVDFEQVSLSNPYSDIASLWAYAIKKPRFRERLLAEFINRTIKSASELAFLRANMLIHSLFELKALSTKPTSLKQQYLNKRKKDVLILKNLLANRL